MSRYYGKEHFEACTAGPPFELSEWPPWDYTPEEEAGPEQQSEDPNEGLF